MASNHECRRRQLLHWTASKVGIWICALVCIATPHLASAKYVKAVTYFGNAWPLNYWNSDLSRAPADFEEIKSDGFNAIILVVPWGEFQPGLKPTRFNDDAYMRLKQVCSQAKGAGLQVHMRVSYQHDMYLGVERPAPDRFDSLLAGDELIPAWQQYLARIADVTRDCASGAFISWEDFWHATATMATTLSPAESAALSIRMGFDAWVRIHADDAYRARYSAVVKNLGAYPVPARTSPDFRMVYKWFDDRLMSHLMPVLGRQLPNSSIEARVDDDPIYEAGKIVEWYSHAQTYQVSSSPYLMTYWAPAMGAENKSDRESATKVIKRFSYINKKIAGRSKNRIIIGQFLFQDNTPSASKNTVIDPAELSDFLKQIAVPLLTETAGYALWGARDYDASVLFNGFFSLNDLGWNLGGGARVIGNTRRKVELPAGAAVTQLVPASRDHFRDTAKAMTLRLEVSGPGELVASYGGSTQRAKVGSALTTLTLRFPVSQVDTEFVMRASSGKLRIGDVYLSDYTQVADVRDARGNPGPRLNDIRRLNKAIDAGGGVPALLAASDNTISAASGVSYPEQSESRWYAWAGPEVSARLLAKNPSIAVKGFIRPSMFLPAKSCTLKAMVDDKEVLSQVYTTDSPIELEIPVASVQVGTVVDLKLLSNCAINPKRQKTGDDDRTLSYLLNTIGSITDQGNKQEVPLTGKAR